MAVRVDSHCHLWRRARGDYAWLNQSDASLGPILRDFEPEDLQRRLHNFDVDAAIVVQAAPSVEETRYLLDLAATTPQILGVVGWVDLSDRNSIEILDHLSGNPKFKGVRPMLQDLEQVDWITTALDVKVVEQMTQLGLRFDALVRAQHLTHLLAFAKKFPALPIVIDHAAKPELASPGDDLKAWREGMQALAAQPNVFCKFSGLLTEMHPNDIDRADTTLASILSELLAWFGSKRLMWGSDWPVVRLASSYDGWSQLTERLLSGLSHHERARILGGTAQEFYGLGTKS